MNLDLKLQASEDPGFQSQITAVFPKGLSQEVRKDTGEGGQSQVTPSLAEELGFNCRANEKLAENSEQGVFPGCHERMGYRENLKEHRKVASEVQTGERGGLPFC